MENAAFILLFVVYACLCTGIYIVYFIGAFEFIYPGLIRIIKDKDTADGIFIVFFWFAAGVILVIIALNSIDNIVLWINNSWINNICKGII